VHDEQLPAEVGLSVTDVEDLDRLLAIGKYEDRYVIPQAHTELASHLMEQQSACSLDFEGGPRNCGTISDPTKASESFMLVRATQHSGLRDAAQLADRSRWIVALSRNEAAAARTVSRTELEPLAHLHHQSDAAFEWGFSTAGSLEVAVAMLAHTTESRPTDLVCRMFCVEVGACLDHAGFVTRAQAGGEPGARR
jgi:hypothetical protein